MTVIVDITQHYIETVVAAAPPLTSEQIETLNRIIGNARRRAASGGA